MIQHAGTFATVNTTTSATTDFISGSLRGWKDTAPPVGLLTAGDLSAKVSQTGYAGSISSKVPGQWPSRYEECENGSLISKSDQQTLFPNTGERITISKRFVDGSSNYFTTVTTRWPSGYPKDTLELKQNLSPPANGYPPLSDLIRWRYSSDGLPTGGSTWTVEDAAHLPSLATLTVMDLTTRRLTYKGTYMMTGSPATPGPGGGDVINSPTEISSESWFFDSRGRLSSHTKAAPSEFIGPEVEKWSYPTEFSMEHTDEDGIKTIYDYDPQGRVLRESTAAVPSLVIGDMGGNPTLSGQDFVVKEWFYGPSSIADSIASTLMRVSSKTSRDAAPPAVGGWQRESMETVDGLGRSIASVDHLGTTRTTSYSATLTSGLVETSYTAGSPVRIASYYLSGQPLSIEYPNVGTYQNAGTSIFYGYETAPYQQTRIQGLSPGPSFTAGQKKVTTDGLGRVIFSEEPTGMTGNALHSHIEARTYDTSNRLRSRSLPGAGASDEYFEVFTYATETVNSIFKTTEKRALTAVWPPEVLPSGSAAPSDPKNESSSTTYYEFAGGWKTVSTTTEGTGVDVSTSSKTEMLGPDTPLSSWGSMGSWINTSAQTAMSGGHTITDKTYRLIPADPTDRIPLTRAYRCVDGALRLTVTSYNGLPMLYDTNGTTYTNKVAIYSPLRERLSNVDASSGYWSKTNVTPSTGLPSALLLPSGTTKETYAYYFGNDIRAGKMSRSLLSGVGAATVYYDYNARGQRTRISGGESPSMTAYDSLGRTLTLSTYRTWASWTNPGTADTTTWNYPNYLSLPTSKVYADSTAVGYTYHKNGALASRTWQRGTGTTTNYVYDSVGRLETIAYPAASPTVAATPNVSSTYNTAGRVATRTEDGQATTTYEYTNWGAPKKETVVSNNTAELPSSVVERTFDANNRPELLKVQSGGATAEDVDYNFNGTGLLGNVLSGGRTITYGYNGVGTMPTSLTYSHNGTTLLSSSRPRNSNGLASGITDSQNGTSFQSLSYNYVVDRVSYVTRNHEQTRWLYSYDQRGQVTSADKTFLYPSEYARGLETDYTYDMAGNRFTKQQGGGGSYGGYSMRSTNYGTTNALNQYTSITHPWSGANTWLDVSGQRGSTYEAITVNSQNADYQQADYVPYYSFRKELQLAPAANQRYLDVTINSSIWGVLDSGKMYVPPASENPNTVCHANCRKNSEKVLIYPSLVLPLSYAFTAPFPLP